MTSPRDALANQVEPDDQIVHEVTLRLSLKEAMEIFIRQNFDLLIARYGIERAKGAKITAGLFPNPVLSTIKGAAFTQNQAFEDTQFITPILEQTFLTAGKRGYRVESAGYGVRSAESDFADSTRNLVLAVKDGYFRIQLAKQRLALALENQSRFAKILKVNTIRFEKGFIAEVDLIRIRLQKVEFDTQVFRSIQEANSARADLRQLLGISPMVNLVLTSALEFTRIDPNVKELRQIALENRPDVHSREYLVSQRRAEFKLSKALQYPDPTVGAGVTYQGPGGNANQQEYTLLFSIPLPIFDRNQGGMVQAEADVQAAETELRKTQIQVATEVDVAYRNLIESRLLVEVFLEGPLNDARETLNIVERAYVRGGATIIELLDAARTSRAIQLNYYEALFNYQKNVFLLENAVGREILI
ncbi:MAG: RND transporter [Nitrospirales bacterium]|nr:MAG: RND transporter [Nitrospirales bacterium]